MFGGERVEMPRGKKECGPLEKLEEDQCGSHADRQERHGPRCVFVRQAEGRTRVLFGSCAVVGGHY